MNKILTLIFLLISTFSYGQNKVWLIGTAHEENNYINPDSLTLIFNKIKPDVILLELEEKHFTKEFSFDTIRYPLSEYLTTNENIASYKYQQQNSIQLRPFDIEGRHDFYEKENYNQKEKKMFDDMLKLYKDDKYSESCKIDFEILLSTLNSYSNLHFKTLIEANSDITTKFLGLKNKINFELMFSVIKRTKKLKNWLQFAKLRKDYWDKRNNAMTDKIVNYCNEFKDKKIIILVGNDHKYSLLELLKNKNIEVKNYFE